ncbi:MAG: YceD family protein [Endozoicomonas sp. (ex Botrylloides leachii)]|nr:YceD family protein [Endozoicomonas sp. (ex Botrylloides leachii)]
MFIGKLPKTIDPRKLARQGMQLEGSLALSRFSRLVDLLSDNKGEVQVALRCDLDEYNRAVLKGHLDVMCKMICQRCLNAADLPIHADVQLVAVWTDEQAKALPSDYEPLFLQEDPIELVPLLEDELLLALPIIPYHKQGQCAIEQTYTTAIAPELTDERKCQSIVEDAKAKKAEKTNPFSVLAKLKAGTKTTI